MANFWREREESDDSTDCATSDDENFNVNRFALNSRFTSDFYNTTCDESSDIDAQSTSKGRKRKKSKKSKKRKKKKREKREREWKNERKRQLEREQMREGKIKLEGELPRAVKLQQNVELQRRVMELESVRERESKVKRKRKRKQEGRIEREGKRKRKDKLEREGIPKQGETEREAQDMRELKIKRELLELEEDNEWDSNGEQVLVIETERDNEWEQEDKNERRVKIEPGELQQKGNNDRKEETEREGEINRDLETERERECEREIERIRERKGTRVWVRCGDWWREKEPEELEEGDFVRKSCPQLKDPKIIRYDNYAFIGANFLYNDLDDNIDDKFSDNSEHEFEDNFDQGTKVTKSTIVRYGEQDVRLSHVPNFTELYVLSDLTDNPKIFNDIHDDLIQLAENRNKAIMVTDMKLNDALKQDKKKIPANLKLQ